MHASELSILRRRDVALYPLILISLGAFALALSQALRPPAQTDISWATPVIVGGSITFGVLVGLFALAQEKQWGKRFLGAVWFYFAGAGVLLVALCTVALLDQGLNSVAYESVMLVGCYAGLVFPRLWSRAAVAGLLLLTAVIQVLRPDANYLSAGTVFALIFVGWLVGLLPRLGHQAASTQALLLSRSDALTGAMNRRGFLEQFAYDLSISIERRQPLALLIIDLNGFKQVNDQQGHAAGDAILAFVGETVPRLLPPGAAFGRLGGDEFAALIPPSGAAGALQLARRIRLVLADRIGASIGVSSHPVGLADMETLMHAADAALYRAKVDPTRRVQYLEADPAPPSTDETTETVARPALTYDRLRNAGESPKAFGAEIFDGRWLMAGFTTIALSGIPIVGNMFLFGGHAFFENVIRYLGIPWALANLAFGFAYRNNTRFIDPPRLPWTMSAVLVAGGVGAAALASGHGITDTIMAAFIMKILFDASMARPGMARENLVLILGFWALTVGLGPDSARWAAPFQLVLLLGAHMLGTIGRAAFESARTTRLQIASTDPLTGLFNRRGFEAAADGVFASAQAGQRTLALITFDLDDFKGINDTRGHAAGDQLLRSVAHLTRDCLRDAYAIGRTGGDEFVALVPVPSLSVLVDQVAELDTGLSVLVGGSIGSAIYGDDGDSLEALLAVADARAYAVKESRSDRHARSRRAAAAAAAADAA